MLHKFHRNLCFGTLAYSPHNWADPGDAGVKQVWHLSSASAAAAAAAAFELMLPAQATHSCGNCWERAAHYLICQYIVTV